MEWAKVKKGEGKWGKVGENRQKMGGLGTRACERSPGILIRGASVSLVILAALLQNTSALPEVIKLGEGSTLLETFVYLAIFPLHQTWWEINSSGGFRISCYFPPTFILTQIEHIEALLLSSQSFSYILSHACSHSSHINTHSFSWCFLAHIVNPGQK